MINKKNQEVEDFSAFDEIVNKSDDDFSAFDQALQPSTEEEYAPQTSMAEAGLRGAAQGLTFGMADEIAARAESLLTGKPYEKALSESRAEYKAGEQEYPITSTLGEVAGGIGQAVGLTALTGGAAAPAAGAGAIGRLAKLGQMAKNVLVPTTSVSALTNIGRAATTGAVMGGLTGIGKSEKEGIEALKEAPSAALAGGVAGGVLGGAVEGLGAAGKKVGEVISKGIDEGKYPELFRMIRTGAKLGGQGKEFLSEVSGKRAEEQALNAAKNVIVPELQTNLNSARELRNFIFQNSNKQIDISDVISELKDKLVPGIESDEILKAIDEFVKRRTVPVRDAYGMPIPGSQGTNLNSTQAYDVRKYLESLIDDKYKTGIKNPMYEAIDAIKNKLRNSVSEEEATKILDSNPILKNQFEQLTKDLPKSTRGYYMDEEIVGPISLLDRKMKGIIDASEMLGGVSPSGKTEAEKLKDIEKIFKNIISQPKETASAFLSEQRFNSAMDSLSKLAPDVAENIKKSISPIVEELGFRKYIRGEGFDRGNKETGFIKKALGDVGKLTAEGVNIASAIKSAAARGTPGPVPFVPTTTLLRPTVATLNKFSTSLDQQMVTNPNSKTLKMFSAMVKNALDQKDESRRAAILNTLMQYKSFRELFKEGEE